MRQHDGARDCISQAGMEEADTAINKKIKTVTLAVKSDVEINHKYAPDFRLMLQSKETGENIITGELQVVILHLKFVMKIK
jgi:hypothetical protein